MGAGGTFVESCSSSDREKLLLVSISGKKSRDCDEDSAVPVTKPFNKVNAEESSSSVEDMMSLRSLLPCIRLRNFLQVEACGPFGPGFSRNFVKEQSKLALVQGRHGSTPLHRTFRIEQTSQARTFPIVVTST